MSDRPSDFVTDLDNVEFDDLFLLARAEIPRYAADWTDHNVHDPGMTLVDLLAWIVDQQIFRIGFVGSRHRRAFAALLGQKPEGAQPARGIVWPSVGLSEGRLVQQGAPVACVARPTLPFALERQLYLTGATLSGAQVTVNDRLVPASEADLDSVCWTLDGSRHQNPTALTLQFSGQLGSTVGTAPLSLGFDVIPHPEPAITPKEPAWGPVRYEYRDGTEEEWTELTVAFDSTAGLATSGLVVVDVPEAPTGTTGAELRLRLDDGFFPVPPQIRAVTINALPVVQLEQVAPAPFSERGTGQPDQSVELVTDDLVAPPSRSDEKLLDIEVDGEHWLQVDDLEESGPGDRHYAVNGDRLVFGNGLNGRCPPPGAVIEQHSPLARTTGAEGNLRSGLTWRLPALQRGAEDFGVNRHAFTGGHGVSTAAELVAKARAAAIDRKAMVTDNDVTRAALNLPGMAVGRAEVLSRFDPRMPGRTVDGVRTLIVVPHGFAPGTASVPQTYIDEVATRLGHRRLVGERLVVQGPTVVRVSVQVEATTEPWADSAAVTAAIEAAVRNRLTAIGVGDVEPWPLGRQLTVSEILSITANVHGVATVTSVRISAIGAEMGEHPVAVPRDGVVVVGAEDVRVHALSDTTSGSSFPGSRGWD
jgi:uncharacterized phage protein gp47/JayE